MPAYVKVLPLVFPHVMVLPVKYAERIISILSASRPDAPGGSSFAVTSDCNLDDHRRLWLSEASYQAIKNNDAVIIRRGK